MVGIGELGGKSLARKKKPSRASNKNVTDTAKASVKDAAESIEDALETAPEELKDAIPATDDLIDETQLAADDAVETGSDQAEEILDAEVIEEIPADPVSEDAETLEAVEASEDADLHTADADPDADPDTDHIAPEADTDAETAVAADADGPSDDPIHDPAEAAMAPPPAEQSSGGAGFIPLLLGGLLAGGIGFFGGRYYDEWAARDYEGPTADGNAVAVASVRDQVQTLTSSVEELSARDIAAETKGQIDEAVSPLVVADTATSTRMDGLEGALSQLSERIETIALRPTATGIEADEFDSALSEFRGQLQSTIDQAQSEIDKARSEAEKISDQAFAAEQSALVKSAWSQIETALESGASYAEPLEELKGAAELEIPAPLNDAAEDGIVTLAKLQQDFPPIARAALNSAQRAAPPAEDGAGRLASFLKAQSGMRSLAPRDGDDPDAVLSRAEAALRDGDVSAALGEIDALPEEGLTVLEDWLGAARTRLDVLSAADQFADQL